MASQWNNQVCELCTEGVLHDGIKTVEQRYKGQIFTSQVRGAFCDHCDDGFVEYDEPEENAWLAFRNQVDAEQAAELARIRKNYASRNKKRHNSRAVVKMPFLVTNADKQNL